MSNTDTVKQIYVAYQKADVSGILSHVSQDVLWSFEAAEPISWAGNRHGKQETLGFFTGLVDQLSDPRLDMQEFIAEGDKVVSYGRFDATVRSTGRRVSTPISHYFRFRDGKVVEFRLHLNSAAIVQAMAASAKTA